MAMIKGLYQVYLAKKGTEFPAKGTFFVIASNGAFVHKDYVHWEGLVPLPLSEVPGTAKLGYFVQAKNGEAYVNVEVPPPKFKPIGGSNEETLTIVNQLTGKALGGDDALLAVDPYINMNLPKYDAAVIYKALLFFRKVYNKFAAEAIVIVAYNANTGEYALFCPKQEVSGGHIDYDRQLANNEKTIRQNEDPEWAEMLRNGFMYVGTIHSHCNFQAFHSGVDTSDEADFDGVHITLGHVVDQQFSAACSLVLNDYREQVELENVVSGVRRTGNQQAVKSTLISTGYQNYYQIDLPDNVKQQLKPQLEAEIEQGWMGKVTKKTFFHGSQTGYYSHGGDSNVYSGYGGYGGYYDDDEDDLAHGTSYILVGNQWVKEVKTRKDEPWDDYVRQHEADKDVPKNFDEWSKQQRIDGIDDTENRGEKE